MCSINRRTNDSVNETPQTPKRRLAAILHADIMGFSALMSADESGTQAAVARVMQAASAMARDRGGRVVSTAGDAFLAEFPSVVEAVSFASDFQTRQADDLTFRIGVNLGDVIVEGDDIFGEGVNVAARVEALAPPGGIAISGTVREQLGNRVDIRFEDGGTHRVKNIPAPVRIYTAKPPFQPAASASRAVTPGARRFGIILATILVLAGLGVYLRPDLALRFDPDVSSEVEMDSRPVLAVLPFREQGGNGTCFGAGFTEDLILHLGRFPDILVLSWNAVAPFRENTDPAELREQFNARYVIDGSVRRNGDRLRVTVQLTDARDGLLLWSERYETPEAELFDVQDRIAGAAAGSLALGVVRLEEQAALDRPTEELDAYDLVLRGRAALRRVDRASNLAARDYFNAALEIDPGYADARAGLAWTFTNEAWWGWSEWPRRTVEAGVRHARVALNTAPGNTTALSALTELYWMQNDLKAAADVCTRAVEANPNDARAHASCGGVLIFSGELEKGIAHGELALRLDPAPTTWLFTNLSIGYFMTGRYEDAIALLSRSSEVINEDPAPHAVLAATYARVGRTEEARQEVSETLRLSPFFDASVFAGNLAATGYEEELLDALHAAGFAEH